MAKKADIGLIGLAVMGENLVLNMAHQGFLVAVFNRTVEKVRNFVSGRGKNPNIIGATDIKEFIDALAKPRKVMLMVKAGEPVDLLIAQIVPHLERGDIIIDGGNSHYNDTLRRQQEMESKGLLYVGCGVSGGELGALTGPSLMPGGSQEAWPALAPILQKIAATVPDGTPCCQWVGPGGAGHFTKMVHNGIEYGDMQLIGETYHFMRDVLGLDHEEMAAIFRVWNQHELNSYLIEITSEILVYKDQNGCPLVQNILDAAGQKGTGKWAGEAAFELGIPLTLIVEAVFARSASAQYQQRQHASKIFPVSKAAALSEEEKQLFLGHLEKALYAAKIISYAQGFALLMAASIRYGWNLNYAEIALMWRGGCIIRSVFLEKIAAAFDQQGAPDNMLLDPYFRQHISDADGCLRAVVATAIQAGIPVPCLSAGLAYFDTYRSARLPANLLQAQRDYFGAHTYERVDAPRGKFFHTDWTSQGGSTTSSSYEA